MKKTFLLGLFLLLLRQGFSQITLTNNLTEKGNFLLASKAATASIWVDSNDYDVVKKSAQLLADDIQRVTDKAPQLIANNARLAENVIIIGTLGNSKWIDKLIATKQLNASAINSKWESFAIKTIQNPFPGVKQALVIVGSDRRGTAYGVFTVSSSIGVSPWYWWADVPVKKQASLILKPINYVSKAPSVKYRGIFINDEDWGLHQWAKNNFDTSLKSIGPKTYEKVFELMLRLRLNYIWPAMHEVSTEFGSIPANAALADSFGIVLGSSHCEPMLYNNVHWDQKKKGVWNYSLNKDSIYHYWENYVKVHHNKEAVWTLGIRGIHDQGMQRPPTQTPDRIDLLQNVFKDQRGLLNQYVTKQWGDVAQCFVPYKEVLPLYDAGLQVPDDVTIMWVDDNFGYIRRLGALSEHKRSGGAGVYWHLSYYGGPHSYLWLNTTPPALMWEELSKAWENDARKIWVINVGDIKPMEIGIDYFSKLAWDVEAIGAQSQPKYLYTFAAKYFGASIAPAMSQLLGEYYRLGTIRKPEEMNRDWVVSLSTDKANALLADYHQLLDAEEKLASAIPVHLKNTYFELVGFSAKVLATSGLIFMSDRKGQLTGDTLSAQKEIAVYRSFLEKQVSIYNNDIAKGKWKHIMPGLETAKNLTQWNSQVRWPWGEKTVRTSLPAVQPSRIWRKATLASSQTSNGVAKWTTVLGLGTTGEALALKPASLAYTWQVGDNKAPQLAYSFETKGGDRDVLIHFLPTFRICPGTQLRVGVSIDGEKPIAVEVPGSSGKEDENGPNRSSGIMNNFVEAVVPLKNLTDGKHVLKIYAMDPGVVIDKISLPEN